MGSILGKKVSSTIVIAGFTVLTSLCLGCLSPSLSQKESTQDEVSQKQQGRVALDSDPNEATEQAEDQGEDQEPYLDDSDCGTTVDHEPHLIPQAIPEAEKQADALFLQDPNLAGQAPTIRVHAVVTADDDGSNPASMTREQVEGMLADANEIFADVGLRFELADLTTVNNTLINNLSPSDRDPETACEENWSPQRGALNKTQLAAFEEAAKPQYARKLVVFFPRFQWGRDETTGDCERGRVRTLFSGTALNFVSMGGLNPGAAFGKSKFAHEAGHYFGLVHTFWWYYEDVNSAVSRINRFAQQNPGLPLQQALDGDFSYTGANGIDYRVEDTAADPGNALYGLYWTGMLPTNAAGSCSVGDGSINLYSAYLGGGPGDQSLPIRFDPLPRYNTMSYYMGCPYLPGNNVGTLRAFFTPGQRDAVWRTIRLDPSRRDLLYLVPEGPLDTSPGGPVN